MQALLPGPAFFWDSQVRIEMDENTIYCVIRLFCKHSAKPWPDAWRYEEMFYSTISEGTIKRHVTYIVIRQCPPAPDAHLRVDAICVLCVCLATWRSVIRAFLVSKCCDRLFAEKPIQLWIHGFTSVLTLGLCRRGRVGKRAKEVKGKNAASLCCEPNSDPMIFTAAKNKRGETHAVSQIGWYVSPLE